MDRSFLSQQEVIEASRRFVCIRLATYESEAEASVLKSIFLGPSGALENTVFCIMSPDGKQRLTQSGRSPHQVVRAPPEFASTVLANRMSEIADRYDSETTLASDRLSLPLEPDLRLAMNVAACDSQPVVVVVGKDSGKINQLKTVLTPLSWSKQFIGHYVYASATPKELGNIAGETIDEGFIVIEPGRFGHEGEVLTQVAASDAASISDALDLGIVMHQRYAKESRSHIQAGIQAGVKWETKIPVTDPHSLREEQRRAGGGRAER